HRLLRLGLGNAVIFAGEESDRHLELRQAVEGVVIAARLELAACAEGNVRIAGVDRPGTRHELVERGSRAGGIGGDPGGVAARVLDGEQMLCALLRREADQLVQRIARAATPPKEMPSTRARSQPTASITCAASSA